MGVKLILRLKAVIWIYSVLLEHNYYLENSSHEGNFDPRSQMRQEDPGGGVLNLLGVALAGFPMLFQ